MNIFVWLFPGLKVLRRQPPFKSFLGNVDAFLENNENYKTRDFIFYSSAELSKK